MVGPGIALEPQHVQHQTVLAPADGVVGALHPHAFALELGEGRTILVHLGIDTVGLAGQGFTLHVDGGQTRARGGPAGDLVPGRRVRRRAARRSARSSRCRPTPTC